jgi:hypothetical protein
VRARLVADRLAALLERPGPPRALLLARAHGQVEDQLRADGLLAAVDGLFPTVEAAVEQAVRITRPG